VRFMPQACRLPLATLVALAAPGAALAQQAPEGAAQEAEPTPRYRVELVLFRYADSVASGNELFAPDPPPEPGPWQDVGPDGERVREFGDSAAFPNRQPPDVDELPAMADDPAEQTDPEPDADTDPASVVLEEIVLPANLVKLEVLVPGSRELVDVVEKLETLDAYEPVLWAGWTQDAVERERSPVIPLRRLGNAPPEFDGGFQLYLSRFLHLVVDLELTPRNERGAGPVRVYSDRRNPYGLDDAGAVREPGTVRLSINEDRIVRDGDLRYFDHPKFGLLAKVTRLEEDEDDPLDLESPAETAVAAPDEPGLNR